MVSLMDLETRILDNYLYNNPYDVKIDQELLWLYIQITCMTHGLTERNTVEDIKKTFISLFAEDIIFFNKKTQIQSIIENDLLDQILITHKTLQDMNTKHHTIEETKPTESSMSTVNNTLKKHTEHDQHIESELCGIVSDVKEATDETVKKTRNVCAKIYRKINKQICTITKTIHGNLSHCFGGGKTSL